MPEKKNTYLTLHKNFVRTDIEYADRVTGESRTFNSVSYTHLDVYKRQPFKTCKGDTGCSQT